jgi:hypothetical protein
MTVMDCAAASTAGRSRIAVIAKDREVRMVVTRTGYRLFKY